MADSPQLHANTHVKLNLGAAGEVEGWYRFDMPTSQLNIPEQKVWDGNGAPLNVISTGTVQWNPVSGSRYLSQEAANTLWDAHKNAIEDPNGAREKYTLEICQKDGTVIQGWELEDAYISSYGTTPQDASANTLASINITVKYANAIKQ